MARYSGIKLVLTGFLLASALLSTSAGARGPAPVDASMTVSVAELPRQGAETYRLILQGGPFPYEKDGTVFGNRERLLPAHKRGYYREYTVPTPGARNRGMRRIVCGGAPKTPDACYYTADHYASFRRIVP
ncbi:MAG: ribonuclease domain-containing protein [Hylemonella sp.]|jgi:ribonuclease T1|uniref:ribonuclease domain-containing protein n=1 Tax=Hylemonella sp. TaxID=2066020 RepID=UPI00391C63E9